MKLRRLLQGNASYLLLDIAGDTALGCSEFTHFEMLVIFLQVTTLDNFNNTLPSLQAAAVCYSHCFRYEVPQSQWWDFGLIKTRRGDWAK
jgi:hypothetical protein